MNNISTATISIDLNDPSKEDLGILVSTFRENDFSIVKLFEATISLKKFWDQNNRLTLVKSPIELVFGTARTIGIKGKRICLSLRRSETGRPKSIK